MTPLSGKLGSIKVGGGGGVSHRLKQWELIPEANIIDSSALGSTADADGNVWRTKIAGLCGGRVSVRGIWDKDNYPTAAAAFRVGLTASLTLGIDAGIAFTCSAIVSQNPISCDVEGEAGFRAELEVTGNVTWPTPPV